MHSMLKSRHVAVFPGPSHGADNWPVIDHSLHRLLLLHSFFFPSLKDAKAQACVCVLVCVCVCCHHAYDTGRVGWGGLRGGEAELGLPVFVRAATNTGRKPGNEVRLRLCQDLSLLPPLHPTPLLRASLPLRTVRIFASTAADSPLGSGMLLPASLVWAIAAAGCISSLCVAWTKR